MRRLFILGAVLALLVLPWGGARAQSSDPFEPKKGSKASAPPSSSNANDPFLPADAKPPSGGGASDDDPGGGQSGDGSEGRDPTDEPGSGGGAAQDDAQDDGSEALPVTGVGTQSWLVIAYALIGAGAAALGYVALTRRREPGEFVRS